jgi:hypothetical protein
VSASSCPSSAADLAAFSSEPSYKEWVSFLPLPINGGFGWANNQAILTLARETSPPDYIHLLNPDAKVTKGAVVHLVDELEAHPRCGAAGSQLLASNGRAVPSAFRFPSPGREFISAAQSDSLGRFLGIAPTALRSEQSTEADWVTGASVMFRSEALRDVGLFDDGFFLYFEEVELMHRLQARGWSVRFAPQSRVIHLEGASTGAGVDSVRPKPLYWYQSRRRYFRLTGGGGTALRADLAWLAGRAFGAVKGLIRSSPDLAGVRAAHMFGAGGQEIGSSIAAWGDPPGKPPAWMARS